MTRWDTAYSEFQAVWTQVKKGCAHIKILRNGDIHKQEQIRQLKKTIQQVDDISTNDFRQVAPLPRIKQCLDILNHMLELIQRYHHEEDIIYITQMNNALEDLLSTMFSRSTARHGAESYSMISEEHTEKFKRYSKKLTDEIKIQKDKLNQERKEQQKILEVQKNKLDQYQQEQQEIIESLKEKIEGLLSGATNVNLAAAFNELKIESGKEIEKYTDIFYKSLFALFIIAGISIIPELCYVSPELFGLCNNEIPDNLLLLWIRGLLAKSLLIAPVLWVVIFASKRRSEHQRLQQEYAHKESVSKTFEGYRKHIEALELVDERLLNELLEIAIKAIGYNASVTLGGKHGDDPPIAEAARLVGLGKNIIKS